MYTYHGRRRRRNFGFGSAMILGLILTLLVLGIVYYLNHIVPRPYPTGYTNTFWGFLHGLLLPLNFIGSLLSDEIAIYQNPNAAGWYDFGFMSGAYSFVGVTWLGRY